MVIGVALLEPVEVGFDAGGVDDEEVGIRGELVGVEVVDGAAGGIGEEGILSEAGLEALDIVGEDMVEEGGATGA